MGNYIPSTDKQQKEMLNSLGIDSFDDLFKVIDKQILVDKLDMPNGVSEQELVTYIQGIAQKNILFKSIFRGAGAYNHYIPAVVKRVCAKEEFVTAYTPYQAEISQGILQSIFEYQTMIANLTDMEASNASVYDGATAAAEAIAMCKDRLKNTVITFDNINPEVLDVINTYCFGSNTNVIVLPTSNGLVDSNILRDALNDKVNCIYLQQPNYYGLIDDVESITNLVHLNNSKVILGINPISAAILKSPKECNVDIVVGEGQPLGMPLSFGGPYLGFMSCTKQLARKLPGRIVGETIDSNNNRCFVLTLQAREQHIRREKASSNICSNQALCAMTAAVYMASMGPTGLIDVANNCFQNAHYLQSELSKIGFNLKYNSEFFHEFLTTCPIDPNIIIKKLEDHNILGGLIINNDILWCATEKNTKFEIDTLISIIKEVLA